MSKEIENSPVSVTETMDTRKFLSAINNSAQAKVAFFENAIRKLGKKHDQNWELTALQSDKLIFEDRSNNEYMIADHNRKKGGRIDIANIRKLDLKEDKKPELFEQACMDLVDAIEEENVKGMDSAFNKLAASRFRSTVVPSDGLVRTKDGIVRQVSVSEDKTLGRRLVEYFSDKFTINESGEIEGSFVNDDLDFGDLGVSELTTRKLVAKNMREAAIAASHSPNFQILVEGVAAFVSNDELEQAINVSSKFLHENQEFCLLDRDQWQNLIENTLATKICFNEDLATDTATLMYKTNLKVNRNDLVDAWRKTAQRAEHPIMLENVDKIDSAEDFESAYSEFLGTIMEATDTTKGALVTGLELLKGKVAEGDMDEITVEEIDNLITDLRDKGDSDSVWKAMEALDSVKRHIDSVKGLDDFDDMPGPLEDEGEEEEVSTSVSGESGSKPLEINVKMDPMAMAKQEEPPAPEPKLEPKDEELGEEGEDDEGEDIDLDDLDLEGDLDDLGEKKKKEDLLAASVEKDDENISEELRKMLKSEGVDDDTAIEIINESEFYETCPECGESFYNDMDNIALCPSCGCQYKPDKVDPDIDPMDQDADAIDDLYDPNEIDDVYQPIPAAAFEDVQINHNYSTISEEISDANVNDFLTETSDDEDAEELQAKAEAYVRDSMKDKVDGISDPKQKQEKVTDLAGKLVAKRNEMRQGLKEDQYKSPLKQLARRGLKKSSVNKTVEEGKLQWLKRENNAVLGEFRGIKFVVDNTVSPTAVLSDDASVVVPIPEEAIPGALYLAEIIDKEAEADAFVEWLDQHIESLRIDEAKDGWPKSDELDKGAFTEYCKERGFDGPCVECAEKAMKSDSEKVRGMASYYMNTVKPNGKDVSDVTESEESEPGEAIEESDVAEEGKCPDHLKQYQFGKKSGEDGKESEKEDEEDKPESEKEDEESE